MAAPDRPASQNPAIDTPALEELLHFLYLMPVGVVKFRAGGAVEMVNPVAAALLLSMKPDGTLQDFYSAISPIAPDLRLWVEKFAAPEGNIVDQRWLRASAGGRSLTVSLTINRIDGDVYMAVLTEVTRLAEQEERLYVDRQKFFAIFDHVRDYAIYTITVDGLIEEWNQSVQRYGGWSSTDVRGRSINLFFPQDDPDQPSMELLLAEAARAGSAETEGWRVKSDGSRMWANSVITALPDEAGKVRGFVVVSRDITERKQAEDEMKQMATVDPLTGAYNRRQGDFFLAVQFSLRARYGSLFALLFVDIDHFKAVNDRFGHSAGDAVLCAVVETFRNTLRPADLVVRWGGEEFLVLMPETDTKGAMRAAERLRAAVEASETTLPGGQKIHVTVSIGVATPSSDSASELLSRSDVALYSAKTAGRNRVILAP